jgi:hypothetical protein
MTDIKETVGNLGNVPGMVDTKREAEGVWYTHDDIEGFKDTLINEDGNGLQAIKVCSRFTAAYRKQEQSVHGQAINKPSNERLGFITDEVAILNAINCVTDWMFTDNDGKEIKCSTDAVRNLYTAEGEKGILIYRFHRMFIEAAITELHTKIEDHREADEGKSESA